MVYSTSSGHSSTPSASYHKSRILSLVSIPCWFLECREMRPRNERNLACGQETNQPVGRKVFSPCRILLYLKDILSPKSCFVDSGASVTVFSALALSSNSGICLVTCSGTGLFLLFGSRCYQWTVQLAPVSVPILRADFLDHHHLLVDIAGDCLLEPSDILTQGESLPTASDSSDLLSIPQAIKNVLH